MFSCSIVVSDRGSIPGLIHRTSGKGFSPRFVSRLLHTPTLTRAELSARLVSARIPHIRGEVVTANIVELRKGEVRILGLLGSSPPALCVATSLCGRHSYVEITGSWPCLHKTLSGAGRWNRANFALTEFSEVPE